MASFRLGKRYCKAQLVRCCIQGRGSRRRRRRIRISISEERNTSPRRGSTVFATSAISSAGPHNGINGIMPGPEFLPRGENSSPGPPSRWRSFSFCVPADALLLILVLPAHHPVPPICTHTSPPLPPRTSQTPPSPPRPAQDQTLTITPPLTPRLGSPPRLHVGRFRTITLHNFLRRGGMSR